MKSSDGMMPMMLAATITDDSRQAVDMRNQSLLHNASNKFTSKIEVQQD